MTSWLMALFLFAARKPAPPAIRPEGVVNAASQMPSQFPGGAIARGSLFRILGVRLGQAGATVRIHQGATTVDAIPTYTSATRIDALLPMSAPAGDVSLTVTYNGQSSAPFPMKVVDSSFGIFTENGAGWGPAIAAPAAPGDTIAIRGTGLGSNRKPEVILSGRRVRRIVYAGPAGRGQDEIRFEIPKDAPPGCYVPIEVHTGGMASNVATIAIAPQGQPCASTAPWLASNPLLLLRLSMQSAQFGPWVVDVAAARFRQPGEFALSMLPPPGVCTAFARTFSWDDLHDLTALETVVAPDGGWLTVSGSEGGKSVTKGPRGPFTYWRGLGGFSPGRGKSPEPLFLEPGDYTITGWGDPDIGPFRAQVTVPPALDWTNQIDTVNRDEGVTVAWKRAGAGSLVVVMATNMDQVTGATALCACVENGSAGHFTIPASMLARLPASTNGNLPFNLLGLLRIPAQIKSSGPVAAAYASWDSRTVNFR